MRQRPFPDFVIAGAMKAGTTAIADILASLPQVSFSVPKEPTLLMRHAYKARNPEFYVPPDSELDAEYAKHFAQARAETLWGEGSVAYLADPDSPAIVTGRNRDVKVIFILRDPAARARSAYLYSRSTFDEPASTMEQAFHEENDGSRDDFWPTLRHLNYSDYPQHLRRWQQALKPGNMLIIEFESYVRAPNQSIEQICDFLGIDAPETLPAKERSNITVATDTPFKHQTMKLLHTRNGLKSLLKPMLPRRFRERLKLRIQDYIATGQGKAEPASAACNEIMAIRFSGMQNKLAEEFGFKPQYWTSGT